MFNLVLLAGDNLLLLNSGAVLKEIQVPSMLRIQSTYICCVWNISADLYFLQATYSFASGLLKAPGFYVETSLFPSTFHNSIMAIESFIFIPTCSVLSVNKQLGKTFKILLAPGELNTILFYYYS